MAELVRKEEMEDIADFLQRHLPESAIVYTVIRRILDGKDPGLQVRKSKSRVPGENAVVAVTADVKKCQNPFYQHQVYLFALDPTKIVETLSSENVMEFKGDIQFQVITEHALPYVSSLMTSQSYQQTQFVSGHQYWCMDEQHIPVLPLMDGLYVSRINNDDIDIIIEKWKFSTEGSESAIRKWIDWDFPSVCIRDPHGNPVAWAMDKFSGDLGTLYVQESHRRLGLGKFVMSELARIKLRKNEPVFVMIEEQNDVSRNLAEAISFKKNENTKFFMPKYSPKQI